MAQPVVGVRLVSASRHQLTDNRANLGAPRFRRAKSNYKYELNTSVASCSNTLRRINSGSISSTLDITAP
jgi:hypothetical protein